MENRLKPQTTPVISELRLAQVRPVMVTGDNMLTALSVARDCRMVDADDKVVLVQCLTSSTSSDVTAKPHLQFSLAEDESRKLVAPMTSAKPRAVDVYTSERDVEKGASAADGLTSEKARVHFAVTGKSWALLRQHYADVIPRIVVRGTVFARFSPDQKQQLVEALQGIG